MKVIIWQLMTANDDDFVIIYTKVKLQRSQIKCILASNALAFTNCLEWTYYHTQCSSLTLNME